MLPRKQPYQCHPAQNQPTWGRWMRKGLPVPGEYKQWTRHGTLVLPDIATGRDSRFPPRDDDSARGTARPNFNTDARMFAIAEELAFASLLVFDSVFIDFFYDIQAAFGSAPRGQVYTSC